MNFLESNHDSKILFQHLVHHTVQYKEKGNILKKKKTKNQNPTKNTTTRLPIFHYFKSGGFATLGALVPKIKVLFRALASKILNMRDNYK